MMTQMGEYVVGAYLKVVECCDFVDYNVRPPEGGLESLNELDVLGLDFKKKVAYICEATTHIRGTLYKNNKYTVETIKKKHRNQQKYAKNYLMEYFEEFHFMFWSPYVPVGYITEGLGKVDTLELIINQEYTRRVDELITAAGEVTADLGNPFFRALQILEHLRH